jgi:hypothetical protein
MATPTPSNNETNAGPGRPVPAGRLLPQPRRLVLPEHARRRPGDLRLPLVRLQQQGHQALRPGAQGLRLRRALVTGRLLSCHRHRPWRCPGPPCFLSLHSFSILHTHTHTCICDLNFSAINQTHRSGTALAANGLGTWEVTRHAPGC